MRWTIGAGLVLAGCTDGNGLIGDDIGQPLDRGDPVSLQPGTPGPDVDASEIAEFGTDSNGVFDGECHALEEPIPTPAMTATGGENQIYVVHFGIPAGDPADFTVTGAVGDFEIDMDYSSPTSDAPVCNWELSYTIVGVSAGTWTIRADGDEATATVTGETW